VTVLDADTPRVRVVVSLDGDRLSLTVGPDLSPSVDDRAAAARAVVTPSHAKFFSTDGLSG